MSKKILRPTVAEINLSALRYNIQALKNKVRTKILAVVKASAYGHGAVEVSRVLSDEGVEMLGVATIEEGIELREAGISIPVFILGSVFPFENYRYVLDYALTPTIASEKSARALEETTRRFSARIAAHVKVDTGMRRIGMSPGTALNLWNKLSKSPYVIPQGIFTHLARADEDVLYTGNQMKQFKDLISRLSPPPLLAHVSNTAGLVNFSQSGLNMARPGLALYGLYPDSIPRDSFKLRPILEFKSSVVFLKNVDKGTPVSYGGTWVAPGKSKIATVCVGYADGYRRALSNNADVIIKGKRCPVVGRVCMDMIMADVSALDEVEVGDEVVLIGRRGEEEITAQELAFRAKTVNYEITCGISSRVPRVYKENSYEKAAF
ncbi:MAG: alanine racemase [Elusimicrobiota bacterium]